MERKVHWCIESDKEVGFSEKGVFHNPNNTNSQSALNRKLPRFVKLIPQSVSKPAYNIKGNNSITSSYVDAGERDWDDEDSTVQTMSMSSDDNWNKENCQSQQNVDLITVKDLNKAFLSRYILERIVHMPLFRKTVLNCFVRINMSIGKIDSNYITGQVIGISRSKFIYPLGSTKTDRELRVQMQNTKKKIPLNAVSNCEFTEGEFINWLKICKYHKFDMPTLKLLNEKRVDIEKAINHVHSNADIDKILKEKHRLGIAPVNISKKKVLLMCERDVAISENNQETLEKLEKELAKIEETLDICCNRPRLPFPRLKVPVPVQKPDTMINAIDTCPYELNNFDTDIDIDIQ